MANMTQFMVVHRSPTLSWQKVEENWAKLAHIEEVKWVRTYFNKEEGVRYCVWLSPGEEMLKKSFTELAINWESIMQVEETVPDTWGKKWGEHLAQEEKAATLAF
jgi:hypothetical protein